MKARKIWIAVHPVYPDCYEVSLTEPRGVGEYLDPSREGNAPRWVEWQEHVCIPIDTE